MRVSKHPPLRVVTLLLSALVGGNTLCIGEEHTPPVPPDHKPKVGPETPKPPRPIERQPLSKAVVSIILDIPTSDAINTAKTTIKDTYKDDYKARRSEEKMAFGQKLLQAGKDTENNPELRFTLWREAGDIAAKNGDLETAEASVDLLEKHFRVSKNAELARIYAELKDNIPSAEIGVKLALGIVGTIENCIQLDQYDIAQRLAKDGESLGRRMRDNGIVNRSRSLGTKAKKLQGEYKTLAEYVDFIGELSSEGHRRTGLFQCIGKNDWVHGLEHLKNGDDPKLAELATRDLDAQTYLANATQKKKSEEGLEPAPVSLLAVADAWYDYAPSQSRGDPREAMLSRAFLWYRRSLMTLDSADRSKCEKRIEELKKALANSAFYAGINYPSGAAMLLTFEPDTLITSGANITGVLDSSLHALRAPASGVKPVRGAFGMALEFDGTGKIDCGTPKQLQIAEDLTITMWMWADSLEIRSNPINKSYAGEGTMTLEPGGTINFFYGVDGNHGENYTSINMSAIIKTKTWYHFALVRNLTTQKKLTWYRNGKVVKSTDSPYPRTGVSTQPLLIGTGYTNPFVGKLDDIGFWPRALTAEEVDALYQATNLGR